jgi:hypothetical protein
MPVTISGDGTITGVEFPVPSIKEKRVVRFTGNGTWTVPAGVTYAIAHLLGGGGGNGRSTGGNGAASSVAFASGTVSANGGNGLKVHSEATGEATAVAGAANSGRSAFYSGGGANTRFDSTGNAGDAQRIVAGAAVTAAASISIVVGAGGTAGTGGAAGGSGYVYIEYEIDPEDEI